MGEVDRITEGIQIETRERHTGIEQIDHRDAQDRAIDC